MGGVHSTPESVAAFVATGLISLAPNVLLLFLPRYATDSRGSSTWLALGQAIGAGGLMADVFLHTLVESSRSNAEMNESMGFYIMLGFVVFFAVDLLVRAVNEQHSISCSHSSSTASQITSMKAGIDGEVDGTVAIKRSLILLNLVADALHNFTDGMAIGASYAINSKATATAPLKAVTVASVWSLFKSHPRGGFATLSILFHEIPHELSDYCTLVRAGYSTRQAILAQLLTAVAAFCGTAVAVAAVSWSDEKLLWMTAGSFLYLAATTILPEVLATDAGDRQNSSGMRRLWFRFMQLLAFCTGILFLSMVDVLSGERHHHHHHDHSSGDHQHEVLYHSHKHRHDHHDREVRTEL